MIYLEKTKERLSRKLICLTKWHFALVFKDPLLNAELNATVSIQPICFTVVAATRLNQLEWVEPMEHYDSYQVELG